MRSQRGHRNASRSGLKRKYEGCRRVVSFTCVMGCPCGSLFFWGGSGGHPTDVSLFDPRVFISRFHSTSLLISPSSCPRKSLHKAREPSVGPCFHHFQSPNGHLITQFLPSLHRIMKFYFAQMSPKNGKKHRNEG